MKMLPKMTSTLVLLWCVAATLATTIYKEYPECNNTPCPYDDDFVLNCSSRLCFDFPPADNLYYAEKIDLSNNNIENITILGAYGYMKDLLLANNSISLIVDDAFKDCPSLTRLDLSGNKLEDFSGSYSLTRLKYLLLQRNRIKTIKSGSFSDFESIETIDMSSNMISRIEDKAFSQLPAPTEDGLSALYLDNNQISTISPQTFEGLDGLSHLSIRNNKLTTLSKKTFRGCPSLRVLDLQNNAISDIKVDAFQGLGALHGIHLAGNKIKRINKHIFEDLKSVSVIELSNNPITYLGAGVFPASASSIDLRNAVRFSKLERGTFTSMRQLKKVLLTNNQALMRLDSEAFDQEFSTVEVLNLYNVSLVTLPRNLVNWTKVNESLELGRNSFHCDCDLAWTTEDWVPQKLKDGVKCSYPKSLTGKHVGQLNKEALKCENHKATTRAVLITIVTIVFIVVLLGVLWLFRRTLLPCCFKKSISYKNMTYVTKPNISTEDLVSPEKV